MEWKFWSSVDLRERDRLPCCSGIYVVADANSFIWYVGQAIDLRNRWNSKGHHRYPQLIRSHRKLSHRIYWKPVNPDDLNEQERLYIALFKPELNGARVKEYVPKQPTVERELQRLLKVFAKPTLLFPHPRSVVVGDYIHENGAHCLILLININDFEILYNSSRKKYAARIRKCWADEKVYCGRNDQSYSPLTIPVYRLYNYQIEFVQMTDFLDYLRKDLALQASCLDSLEVFGIRMSALQNLSVLNDITFKEEYDWINFDGKKSLTDAAYLNYRKSALQPLDRTLKLPWQS